MNQDLHDILERYQADLSDSLELLRQTLDQDDGANPLRELAGDMARELREVQAALRPQG